MLLLLLADISVAVSISFGNNACRHLYDYPWRAFSTECYETPDYGAITPRIIENHGFQVESYNVTTPDGYILQLFRVPPKLNDNRKNKQPIVFVTGILSDSSAYVFVGGRSLPLSLAAEGYDIWLTNHRGSKYSPGHVSLDRTSEEYWNWTIDTVAKNDVPTCLEKIADVTGRGGSIIYVGHSRGTIIVSMYAVNNPEEKFLKGVIGLAPCSYLDPSIHIRMAFSLTPLINNIFPGAAFFQNQDLVVTLAQIFCPNLPHICKLIAIFFSGQSHQFLPDDLLNFFAHFPSPYSVKESIHLYQLMESGRLQKFDYGKSGNLEIYGREKPPIYDLANISVPFFLYYGLHDVFVTNESVTKQYNDLGSEIKGIYKIPVDIDDDELQWAHTDFLYGRDLQRDLNNHIKTLINEMLQA